MTTTIDNPLATSTAAGTRLTFCMEDVEVKMDLAPRWSVRSDRKTRVFTSGANLEKPADLEYTLKGDDPEMDARWAKFNRAEVATMRELADFIFTNDDFRCIFVGGLDPKLSFSRTAGCPCGCSAGFIASKKIEIRRDDTFYVVTDIFITQTEVN